MAAFDATGQALTRALSQQSNPYRDRPRRRPRPGEVDPETGEMVPPETTPQVPPPSQDTTIGQPYDSSGNGGFNKPEVSTVPPPQLDGGLTGGGTMTPAAPPGTHYDEAGNLVKDQDPNAPKVKPLPSVAPGGPSPVNGAMTGALTGSGSMARAASPQTGLGATGAISGPSAAPEPTKPPVGPANASQGVPDAAASTVPTGVADLNARRSMMTTRGQLGQAGSSAAMNAGKGALTGASLGTIVPGVGNAVGGAIGAGVGALAGLIGGRKAESAKTDVTSGDAATIIADAIQTNYGRTPSQAEVAEILRGQGLQPGSSWVGSKGLDSVLASIASSPEAASWASQQQELASLGVTDPQDLADYQKLSNPERVAATARLRAQREQEIGSAKPPEVGASGTNSGAVTGDAGVITDGRGFAGDSTSKPGSTATPPSTAFRGQLMGFDSKKLDDPAHNSPKYVFGKIAQKYDVKDPAQRLAMLKELQGDPSGYFKNATLTGKKGDILQVNGELDPKFDGYSQFDVINAAGEGGKGWQWGPIGAGNGQPDPPTGKTGSGMTTSAGNPFDPIMINEMLSKAIKGQASPSNDADYGKQLLQQLMQQLALGGALRT